MVKLFGCGSAALRCLAIVLIAAAQAIGAAAADAPRVAVHRIDGHSVSGALMGLNDESISLSDDQGATVVIPRADALRLQFGPSDSASSPESDTQPWVLFANGDRLAATVQSISDDRLMALPTNVSDRTPLSIPLELLLGVIVQPPEFRAEGVRLLNNVTLSGEDADTFFLTDDSRLAGELIGLDDAGWSLETSVGAVPVDPQRIRAVAFNPSLISSVPRPETACRVALRDGSWITLTSLTFTNEGNVTGLTTYGEPLPLAVAEIRSVAYLNPRVRALDELEPIRTSAVSYLGEEPRFQVNRNACGGFLTIQGREFARGIGMDSGVALTWQLAPGDSRFQATIGVDDCARSGGSVRFIVELDGRRVYASELLHGGEPAVAVGPIALSGAAELTLRVDFGEYGNIQDFADWCEPLILQ